MVDEGSPDHPPLQQYYLTTSLTSQPASLRLVTSLVAGKYKGILSIIFSQRIRVRVLNQDELPLLSGAERKACAESE